MRLLESYLRKKYAKFSFSSIAPDLADALLTNNNRNKCWKRKWNMGHLYFRRNLHMHAGLIIQIKPFKSIYCSMHQATLFRFSNCIHSGLQVSSDIWPHNTSRILFILLSIQAAILDKLRAPLRPDKCFEMWQKDISKACLLSIYHALWTCSLHVQEVLKMFFRDRLEIVIFSWLRLIISKSHWGLATHCTSTSSTSLLCVSGCLQGT